VSPQRQRRRGSGQEHRDAADGRHETSTAPEDVEAIRALVRAELRSILGPILEDKPATYSTRRGEWPPGYSRDAWRNIARRIGTRRGRWWVVSADALAAYERGERAQAAAETPAWSPTSALASVGLRGAR
jgi:hypothetical protein